MPNNYPASNGAQSSENASPREKQVAVLATLRNADIGLALGISVHTVNDHLVSLKRKYPELETKADIALWAQRNVA